MYYINISAYLWNHKWCFFMWLPKIITKTPVAMRLQLPHSSCDPSTIDFQDSGKMLSACDASVWRGYATTDLPSMKISSGLSAKLAKHNEWSSQKIPKGHTFWTKSQRLQQILSEQLAEEYSARSEKASKIPQLLDFSTKGWESIKMLEKKTALKKPTEDLIIVTSHPHFLHMGQLLQLLQADQLPDLSFQKGSGSSHLKVLGWLKSITPQQPGKGYMCLTYTYILYTCIYFLCIYVQIYIYSYIYIHMYI